MCSCIYRCFCPCHPIRSWEEEKIYTWVSVHWAIIYSIIHEKFQIFLTVRKTSHTAQFFSFFLRKVEKQTSKLADYILKCFSVYRPHVLVATRCDWMAYIFSPILSVCVYVYTHAIECILSWKYKDQPKKKKKNVILNSCSNKL